LQNLDKEQKKKTPGNQGDTSELNSDDGENGTESNQEEDAIDTEQDTGIAETTDEAEAATPLQTKDKPVVRDASDEPLFDQVKVFSNKYISLDSPVTLDETLCVTVLEEDGKWVQLRSSVKTERKDRTDPNTAYKYVICVDTNGVKLVGLLSNRVEVLSPRLLRAIHIKGRGVVFWKKMKIVCSEQKEGPEKNTAHYHFVLPESVGIVFKESFADGKPLKIQYNTRYQGNIDAKVDGNCILVNIEEPKATADDRRIKKITKITKTYDELVGMSLPPKNTESGLKKVCECFAGIVVDLPDDAQYESMKDTIDSFLDEKSRKNKDYAKCVKKIDDDNPATLRTCVQNLLKDVVPKSTISRKKKTKDFRDGMKTCIIKTIDDLKMEKSKLENKHPKNKVPMPTDFKVKLNGQCPLVLECTR